MEFSRGFGVRWLGLSLLAGWLVLGCLWQPAWGQPDFFWNAGSGDWGTATNWNPPTGPPNATQNAFLESNDAISRTVTFNNI